MRIPSCTVAPAILLVVHGCRIALPAMPTAAPGGLARPAAARDEGIKARRGFEQAALLVAKPALTVEEITLARTGASDCWQSLDVLMAITDARSRKPVYDADTETIETAGAKLTLNQLRERCMAMWQALENRMATGCGFRHIGLESFQTTGGAWTDPTYSGDSKFRAASCGDMPAASNVARTFHKLDAAIAERCGYSSIVILKDGDWRVEAVQPGVLKRSVTATCWARGELPFLGP